MKLADDIRELEGKKDVIVKETDKAISLLEKKRQELNEFQLEQEKFIEGRKDQLSKALGKLEIRVNEYTDILKMAKSELSKFFKQIVEKVDTLFDQTFSLIEKADNLLARSKDLVEVSESIMKELHEREKELDLRIVKYSEEEKKLTAREDIVRKMAQEAQNRLKKARDIVFWHKKPGIYKE